MTTPRVSIGLPVYNGERFLAQTMESLFAQTFTDFEVIISDNASTDRTEAMCREFAAQDKRVRYERQEINRGSMWNFNHVFHLARGAYFRWNSYDDLSEPVYLQKCVEVLDTQPDVLWCHSLTKHIDAAGKLLFGKATIPVTYVEEGPEPTRAAAHAADRFRAVMLGRGGCLDSYGLIRSEILRQTGLYPPYFGSEKVLMAELGLWGRFLEIPETLYYARVHEQACGNLQTAQKQRAFINPLARGRWHFARLGLLRGYLAAIGRAPIDRREKVSCYGAVFQYLVQVKKWKSVIAKLFTGAGLVGEYPTVPARAES